MTAHDQTTRLAAPVARWARRLRIGSIVVLLAGTVIAGAVYAFGTGPAESDDPATIAEDKIDTREVGRMYGDMGVLEWNWARNLEQPGTQAMLIVTITVVAAGGCFGAAQYLERKKLP